MPSHPKSDAEFVIAARSIALPWLDFFARQKTAPDDAANLMVAALVEVVAQQIGPFRAIERLRDAADVLEAQMINGAP
jgi:hypothetical protein